MPVRFPPTLLYILLFAILLLCGGGQPLVGQSPGEVKLNVNVLSNRIAIGQIGTLHYTITGGDAPMPETIAVEGLEVVHSGNQSNIKLFNGVQTIEVTHFYRFRSNEAGTYTIPPLTTMVGRVEVSAPAVEVVIFERDQTADLDATRPYFAKLELTKDEFYVNEIVPLTLTGYVRGRNTIDSVTRPEFSHDSFVIKGFKEVQTDGAELGGNFYSTATLPSQVFAMREGQHRLGPATLGIRLHDSSQGQGFGFSSFFNRTVSRELTSNTVNVTVKRLPFDAPRSFTGGVGSFEMTAKPSTTEIGVGDPISMEFVVTGVGNLNTMSAPMFAIPQKGLWRSYEPSKQLDEDRDSDGHNPGTVVFSQVIIPEVKLDKIPPFELSYFDPAVEEYITLTSEEFPLQMSADQVALSSIPPREEASGPANGGFSSRLPAAQQPVASFDDMLHIRTVPPTRWIAQAEIGSPGMFFYAVQFLFSAGFFGILTFGGIRLARRWERQRSNRPRTPSFRVAMKRLPGAGVPRRDFYRAVSEAMDLWRREHPEAPDSVSKVIERISAKCDSILYSGTPDEGLLTREEAEQLRSTLNKLPRK